MVMKYEFDRMGLRAVVPRIAAGLLNLSTITVQKMKDENLTQLLQRYANGAKGVSPNSLDEKTEYATMHSLGAALLLDNEELGNALLSFVPALRKPNPDYIKSLKSWPVIEQYFTTRQNGAIEVTLHSCDGNHKTWAVDFFYNGWIQYLKFLISAHPNIEKRNTFLFNPANTPVISAMLSAYCTMLLTWVYKMGCDDLICALFLKTKGKQAEVSIADYPWDDLLDSPSIATVVGVTVGKTKKKYGYLLPDNSDKMIQEGLKKYLNKEWPTHNIYNYSPAESLNRFLKCLYIRTNGVIEDWASEERTRAASDKLKQELAAQDAVEAAGENEDLTEIEQQRIRQLYETPLLPDSTIVTKEEVAVRLGISKRTLDRHLKSKKFTAAPNAVFTMGYIRECKSILTVKLISISALAIEISRRTVYAPSTCRKKIAALIRKGLIERAPGAKKLTPRACIEALKLIEKQQSS